MRSLQWEIPNDKIIIKKLIINKLKNPLKIRVIKVSPKQCRMQTLSE